MVGSNPGPCPMCGAAHTACTSGTGPITVVQLPARDAAAARTSVGPLLGPDVAPTSEAAAADAARLGDASDDRPFSTATYRGTKKRGRSSHT